MAIKNVDAPTLKQWMEKGEAKLIDVREVSEWKEGYIPGAQLIPLATISAQALPAIEDKKLVIYCRSGKRSLTACNTLIKQNPTLEVYNLEGGILAWQALQQK